MIITTSSAQFATEPSVIFDKLLPGNDFWRVDSKESPIHYFAYSKKDGVLYQPRYEKDETLVQQTKFGEITTLAQVSILDLIPQKHLVLKTSAEVYARSEIVLRSTYALAYKPGKNIKEIDRTKYLDWEGNILDEDALRNLLGPTTSLNFISVLTIPRGVLPKTLDEGLLFNITEKSETIEKSFKALSKMCKISPPTNFRYKTTAFNDLNTFRTKNEKSKP